MTKSRADITVIVVGGGGTIGSSTALHLVRSGYTPSNITVLDTYPIPSAQSAGNDLNKIMGVRLRNPVDLQLSLEARQMWKEDDLFKPFFHNTGRVSNTEGNIAQPNTNKPHSSTVPMATRASPASNKHIKPSWTPTPASKRQTTG
jgi:nucleoside-diphosphate-sugar epimerase